MRGSAAESPESGSERSDPGDRVVYVDTEEIEWGPWEVVSLARDSAVVRVEGTIEHPVPMEMLRRLNPQGPVPN